MTDLPKSEDRSSEAAKEDSPLAKCDPTPVQPVYCAFCRKHYKLAGPLAEGPDKVYICLTCCLTCASIIHQENERRAKQIPRKDVPIIPRRMNHLIVALLLSLLVVLLAWLSLLATRQASRATYELREDRYVFVAVRKPRGDLILCASDLGWCRCLEAQPVSARTNDEQTSSSDCPDNSTSYWPLTCPPPDPF
jgi:hypothetical protein